MTIQTPLSPELQLILLCAHTEMTDVQVERLCALAGNGLNWDRLLQLAAVHGLRPLVYRNLNAHCRSVAPAAVIEQLHHAFRLNAVNALLLTSELEKILAALEASAIPVIPYKGVTLGERLYGDAALRESGDIDIIVARRHVDAVIEQLQGQGYVPEFQLSARQEEVYRLTDCEVNFQHPKLHTHVEVHWGLMPSAWGIQTDWEGIWQRALRSEIGTQSVHTTLSAEDETIILCVHGTKHRWESLKWLADVAQQIERNPNMDWAVIMGRARQWRVERMVQLGVYLSAELLEGPLPDGVDGDSAIINLLAEVLTVIEREQGTPESDLSRLSYLLRMRDNWPDRARHGWRLVTGLNFQDIDDEDRSLAAYYLQRPLRIIRKNGWRPLTKLGAQMLASLNARRS